MYIGNANSGFQIDDINYTATVHATVKRGYISIELFVRRNAVFEVEPDAWPYVNDYEFARVQPVGTIDGLPFDLAEYARDHEDDFIRLTKKSIRRYFYQTFIALESDVSEEDFSIVRDYSMGLVEVSKPDNHRLYSGWYRDDLGHIRYAINGKPFSFDSMFDEVVPFDMPVTIEQIRECDDVDDEFYLQKAEELMEQNHDYSIEEEIDMYGEEQIGDLQTAVAMQLWLMDYLDEAAWQ